MHAYSLSQHASLFEQKVRLSYVARLAVGQGRSKRRLLLTEVSLFSLHANGDDVLESKQLINFNKGQIVMSRRLS